MEENVIEKFEESIRNKIYSIRGYQVMLDRDLAELYEVEVKYLKRTVKRNIERFPRIFCFSLNNKEISNLRCQIGTSSWGGTRYLPYAFTEQGVAMLSAVLKSKIAIEISIKIMSAFIEMRKMINTNSQIFHRMDRIESKQIESDSRIDQIFSIMESKDAIPKQKIISEGEFFDAYNFLSNIFRKAEKSITIIDNYIDDSVLIHLTKVKENVIVKILTRSISDELKLDIKKFEKQYFPIKVKVYKKAHDRFIIIDEQILYHFGASLKDLGNKLFGFSKFDKSALKLLDDI